MEKSRKYNRPPHENPLYHDTWKLLKNYRDVKWSVELSIQQLKQEFELDYGSDIESFLNSVYIAGADLSGGKLEDHARCIERSYKMLQLLDAAINILREKHKHGEKYYWILFYAFLSTEELDNVEEILDCLSEHLKSISYRTYYQKRREAIDALSSILWGYTSKNSLAVLNQFQPDERSQNHL